MFSPLIIHNHGRKSPITRVPHTETWKFFTSSAQLSYRLCCSPKVVKEEIMKDINDLVQEFRTTSNEGAYGASLSEMRHLYRILEQCSEVSLY